MPVIDKTAALAPYLRSVLDDREVQAAVRRAVTAGRDTYQRARGKSPAEAVSDKRLRRRARQAVAATWEVWLAVTAPEPRRPPRWRRRLVLVTAVSVGTYAASNAEMREAVLGLFGGDGARSAGSNQ